MKSIFNILSLILSLLIIFSCSKNEEAPQSEQINVRYRITVPDGFEATAAFTAANFTVISQDNIKGSWTSEKFTLDRTQVTITVGASSDDASSEGELLVEILIDGVVAKEAKAKGNNITLSVSLGN